MHVQSSGKHEISAGNVLASLFREEESQAVFLLKKQGVTRLDITRYLSHGARKNKALPMKPGGPSRRRRGARRGGARRPARGVHHRPGRARAEKGLIDPLVGRKRELSLVCETLARRRKNNPVLVGDPGVGKTAIVEGLALAIHEGNVPESPAPTRASTRSTWARCSPAPATAATSRSASRR